MIHICENRRFDTLEMNHSFDCSVIEEKNPRTDCNKNKRIIAIHAIMKSKLV